MGWASTCVTVMVYWSHTHKIDAGVLGGRGCCCFLGPIVSLSFCFKVSSLEHWKTLRVTGTYITVVRIVIKTLWMLFLFVWLLPFYCWDMQATTNTCACENRVTFALFPYCTKTKSCLMETKDAMLVVGFKMRLTGFKTLLNSMWCSIKYKS